MTIQDTKGAGKHNRQHERVEISEALRFHIGDDTSPTFWTGLVRNISNGGLFVNTYNLPPIGETVSVRVRLPGAPEAVNLRATVVWTRSEHVAEDSSHVGFGARFLDLAPEAEKALNAYLKKAESIFHDTM
jgi:uncharacterized protein (TIGR02266 family)